MQDDFKPAAPQQAGEPTARSQFYNPGKLLDKVSEQLRVSNDAALSRVLKIAAPVISKIRHGHLPVRAFFLLRMNEVSGLSIVELCAVLGDRRRKFRMA
ncbi:hypothetical protein ACFDR9_001808 [Janthinobacterium sp. CG_23.3]|uniref:hypothetical protein n=1 Tax=unclassified Janthinobacterium TaxID=2610881 RepID=UPI0003498666|nr:MULTISPECIES: hypothetical protein [unclassified Janthinobacterium]MEC5159544.1 hypothetical protein [Janthinobacterium sp. CG_S6]